MADTYIEWTDATWNPVAGCSLASAGCKHCYAMNMASRLEAMGIEKYNGLTKKRKGSVYWNGIVREDRESLLIPYRWKKPRKIFVNSMSDLIHSSVSDEFILSVWEVMRNTPQHNYQILTKRPARMRQMVTKVIKDLLEIVRVVSCGENAEVGESVDLLSGTSASFCFFSFVQLI